MTKPPMMKPHELEKFLTEQDLSDKDFANIIAVTPNCIKFWIEGDRKIPPTTAKLVRYFESHPKAMREF
jgi:plasmid maintenance system antidote protein VapI